MPRPLRHIGREGRDLDCVIEKKSPSQLESGHGLVWAVHTVYSGAFPICLHLQSDLLSDMMTNLSSMLGWLCLLPQFATDEFPTALTPLRVEWTCVPKLKPYRWKAGVMISRKHPSHSHSTHPPQHQHHSSCCRHLNISISISIPPPSGGASLRQSETD